MLLPCNCICVFSNILKAYASAIRFRRLTAHCEFNIIAIFLNERRSGSYVVFILPEFKSFQSHLPRFILISESSCPLVLIIRILSTHKILYRIPCAGKYVIFCYGRRSIFQSNPLYHSATFLNIFFIFYIAFLAVNSVSHKFIFILGNYILILGTIWSINIKV